MIHFVIGKPGDGKTLYSIHVAIKRLVQTECCLVTNVKLDLGRLNEYIQEKYPQANVDIHSRVRLLEQEDVPQFFRFRAPGLTLPFYEEKDERGKSKERQQFLADMSAYFREISDAPQEQRRPVFYVIDEAHDFFNAREWASTGKIILYYVSKHRHLGDDVIFITQHLEQTEKQLRNLTSEFHRIRNFYRRNWGVLASRGRFERSSYYMPPTNGANVKAFETSSFALDASGVASCYNTRGALGLEGTTEQRGINDKPKLPWWTLWAGLAAAVVVLFVLLWSAPRVVAGYLDGLTGTVAEGITPAAASSVPEPASPSQGVTLSRPAALASPVPPSSIPVQPDQVKRYQSLAVFGDQIRVVLPTGEIYTHLEPELESIDHRRVVTISGIKYFPPANEQPRNSMPLPPPEFGSN